MDVFNLFNNVVFGGIQTNITNANFDRVRSQTNTPRVGQIKVNVTFSRLYLSNAPRRFKLNSWV